MAAAFSDLLRAMRLTRRGRLMEATRLIQRTLDIPEVKAPAQRVVEPVVVPVAVPVVEPVHPLQPSQPPKSLAPRDGEFTQSTFTLAGHVYPYRLYIPSASVADPQFRPPLVVMLHGCKQDATDFARGTSMNAVAEAEGCLVLYPEQLARSNAMCCWNWFDRAHQARGAGEPEMIAALTRSVIAERNADPARVYVAGLSAGGAMAAVVAALYPDVFAAVGVHSGIPRGAASDVISAFSTMRRGPSPTRAAAPHSTVPMIVFQGTADKTVHPDNAKQLIASGLAALHEANQNVDKTEILLDDSSRPTTRTTYADASGAPQLELWTIEGSPHAWSGGNAEGSYTDSEGPDASKEMLTFFLHHQLAVEPVPQQE